MPNIAERLRILVSFPYTPRQVGRAVWVIRLCVYAPLFVIILLELGKAWSYLWLLFSLPCFVVLFEIKRRNQIRDDLATKNVHSSDDEGDSMV